MKLITSFFALTALTLTSAFAQEESPATSATVEEKASATVETTPEATPAEKASPTPAARATATPGESSAEKKDLPQKSASPAAAKASPTPSGKKLSGEAGVREMENRWEAAVAKHDTATIESIVADDFIGVSAKNKVQSRRTMLGEMKADKDTYTSAKNEKLDVHMYGNGVAVVVGTVREKGSGKNGKAFDKTYRFTDTWMERNGQWKCVASQVTLVSQK